MPTLEEGYKRGITEKQVDAVLWNEYLIKAKHKAICFLSYKGMATLLNYHHCNPNV